MVLPVPPLNGLIAGYKGGLPTGYLISKSQIVALLKRATFKSYLLIVNAEMRSLEVDYQNCSLRHSKMQRNYLGS